MIDPNHDADRRPATSPSPQASGGTKSKTLKGVVIVLAVIGGIAVLGAIGMGAMHFGMMGGMGMGGMRGMACS